MTYICSDRVGGAVNQSVVHGVINSFVSVEQYKSKQPLEVRFSFIIKCRLLCSQFHEIFCYNQI